MTSKRLSHLLIRASGEYGSFYVTEYPIRKRADGQGWDAAAEFVCNSSFGCFAHYWASMGEPFGKFIADLDEGYLLSKIGRRVIDSDRVVKEVKRLIRSHRRTRNITAEEAREAYDDVEAIAGDCDDSVLCHMLYCSAEISKCDIDLSEIDSMTWDGQSKGFVRKLWPEFVREFNRVHPRTSAELLSV